jgi:hypothetical protein
MYGHHLIQQCPGQGRLWIAQPIDYVEKVLALCLVKRGLQAEAGPDIGEQRRLADKLVTFVKWMACALNFCLNVRFQALTLLVFLYAHLFVGRQ